MARLRILTLFTVILSALIFFFKKRQPTTIAEGDGLVVKKEWLVTKVNPLTQAKDSRPADQTFLTFPEWYLVFSPEEQADYFKHTTATTFPFMNHTRQIWESYHIVNKQIKGNFPVNNGYHFMIWVIGSSATVEYSVKALYETLIGRMTDTHEVLTEEDQFNATFTNDYVNFIKDRPWYEFDFKSRVKTLWTSTPFFGDHFLRKIERRYLLTSELAVKYVYGKLIGLGTQQVYDEALPTTAVVLNRLPVTDSLKVEQSFGDSAFLIYLPRYDRFNPSGVNLAKKGYQFKEIAGNNSAILLTILTDAGSTVTYGNAQVIFTQPIASDLTRKRIALAVPVSELSRLLLLLSTSQIKVEHVFDF